MMMMLAFCFLSYQISSTRDRNNDILCFMHMHEASSIYDDVRSYSASSNNSCSLAYSITINYNVYIDNVIF